MVEELSYLSDLDPAASEQVDVEMWMTRRASMHDREALAALCRSAVGEDDYVLEILDDHILRAVTYVALEGDRIVGSMTYREVFDGSAWLSAARTHPDYREKGVATSLLQSLEGVARMKGLPTLRLWTSASNAAGVASFQSNGFREVARFTRMQAPAARSETKSHLEPLRYTESLWSSIESSDVLRRSNFYLAHEYVFVPVARATIHLLSSKGALWGWDRNGVALAEATETFVEHVLELEPLFGDVAAILKEAPAIAKARGKTRVESFLPHDRAILEVARDAGFKPTSWGQEAILCEKSLGVAKVVTRVRKTYAEIAASKRSGYAALALLAPSGHSHGHTGPHEDRWNP